MSIVMEPTATRRSAAGRLVLEPVQTVGLSAVALTDGEWLIGSDAQCAIHAQMRGLKPHHATIVVRDGQTVLTALDPRTWHNGGPLREDVPLRDGDRVTIGPLAFHVTKADVPEPKFRDFAPHEQADEHKSAERPRPPLREARLGNAEDTVQLGTSDADLIREELQQVLARMEPLLEAQQHIDARNRKPVPVDPRQPAVLPAETEPKPARKSADDAEHTRRREQQAAELDDLRRVIEARGERLDAREKAQTRKTEQLATQTAALQERERQLLQREASVAAQAERETELQARYQNLLQAVEEREQNLLRTEEALAADKKHLDGRKATLEQQIKDHQAAVEKTQREAQSQREESQEWSQKNQELARRADELKNQAKDIAAKEAELALARKQGEQEKRDLEAQTARLRDERRQFDAERRKQPEAPQSNDAQAQQLADLKRNQERCQQEQKELSERMREVAALQADCEQTRQRYQGRLNELDTREAKLDKLQESLAQREQESGTQLEESKSLEKLRQKLARRQSRLKSAEQELIRSGTALDQTCEDVLYRWRALDDERVELLGEREWLDHEWSCLLDERRQLQRERDDLLQCEVALATTAATLEDSLTQLETREADLHARETEYLANTRVRTEDEPAAEPAPALETEPAAAPLANTEPQTQSPERQPACEPEPEAEIETGTEIGVDIELDAEIVPSTFVVDDRDGAPSVEPSPSEPDPDPDASELVSLRSTLIEMFDLGDTPGSDASADVRHIEAPPKPPQGPQHNLRDEQVDEQIDEKQRDEFASELVTARLFAERYHNADEPPVDAAAGEVKPPQPSPAPQPVVQPATPEAAEHCDLNESIANFMQRLLGRSEKTPPAAQSSPANHDAPHLETLAVGENVCEIVSSYEPPPADVGPVRPIDKDAERANLNSFRAVANLSARAAVAQHQVRLLRRHMIWNAAIAALCLAGAALLLTFAHVFGWLLPPAATLTAIGGWRGCIAALNWRRASHATSQVTAGSATAETETAVPVTRTAFSPAPEVPEPPAE